MRSENNLPGLDRAAVLDGAETGRGLDVHDVIVLEHAVPAAINGRGEGDRVVPNAELRLLLESDRAEDLERELGLGRERGREPCRLRCLHLFRLVERMLFGSSLDSSVRRIPSRSCSSAYAKPFRSTATTARVAAITAPTR